MQSPSVEARPAAYLSRRALLGGCPRRCGFENKANNPVMFFGEGFLILRLILRQILRHFRLIFRRIFRLFVGSLLRQQDREALCISFGALSEYGAAAVSFDDFTCDRKS